MFYVWETRRRSVTEVLAPAFDPTVSKYGVSLFAGRRVSRELPELEVAFDADPQARITDDLVIHRRRCIVHSERLIDVLHGAGVKGIDHHACRLVNTRHGLVHRTHWAANLLDVIHCIDEQASQLERDDEEPTEIYSIRRLELIESRLGDVPMFRLGERRNTVIVHERIKRAVEAAGITGPRFLPASGYREWGGYATANPRNVIGTHDQDPDGPPSTRLMDGPIDPEDDDEGEVADDDAAVDLPRDEPDSPQP